MEFTQEKFFVCGPSLRTSAAQAGGDIGAFWGRFMAEAWLQRLPSGDGSLYAVYCDYQSDFRGAYTMVLGVRDEAEPPDGARRVEIPAGRYEKFSFAGDPKSVVWGAWNHINSEWAGRAQRSYSADYERYSLSRMGENHAEGEIAVGLR